MKAVAAEVADGNIPRLVEKFLTAGVMEDGVYKPTTIETPQGGVISPLLANVYLHLLDRIWERHDLERRYRARLVRYCDDFVVLCAGDVERPLAVVRHLLERLGLQLNEAKTQVVDARQSGSATVKHCVVSESIYAASVSGMAWTSSSRSGLRATV